MAHGAIILDFDGTLTEVDILEYLATTIGKGDKSRYFRLQFQAGLIDGIMCLMNRIRLLEGMDLSSIQELLGVHLLREGHQQLESWLKSSSLTVILVSGNICPVVQHYASKFAAQRVFCTEPVIQAGRIIGGNSISVGKSIDKVCQYLKAIDMEPERVIAIGDDLSDVPFFELAGWSVSFNGKGDANRYAKQRIVGNLRDLTAALKLLVAPT